MSKIWQEEFNSVDELIKKLQKHRYWQKIDVNTLDIIFNHLYKSRKNIPVRSHFQLDDMQNIRNFLIVSEEYKLVENNYIKLVQTEEISNMLLLSMFAITLERLGASIAQGYSYNNLSEKELKHTMAMAELSYQCSVLCDRYLFPSYYGAIFCCSIFLDLKYALKWKERFNTNVEKLKTMDDVRLNYYQIATKNDKEGIAEIDKMIKELVQKLSLSC